MLSGIWRFFRLSSVAKSATAARQILLPLFFLFATLVSAQQAYAQQAPTTTQLSLDQTSTVTGQTVAITVTVVAGVPRIGEIPTGSVTLSGAGLNTTLPLDGTGTAFLSTTELVTGTITANYTGGPDFTGSMDTESITVNKANVTIAADVSPNPSVVGQTVTVSATVTADAPGSGTPTGTVSFSGPNGVNQIVPIDAAGVATFTTSDLRTGSVNVSYAGDTGYNGNTGLSAFTVNPADTTTTVSAIPDPSVSGESVTVTATVAVDAPGSGIATGTVTFTGNGGLNQTVTLDITGQATFTSTELETGTITATYNGDSDRQGSTGNRYGLHHCRRHQRCRLSLQ